MKLNLAATCGKSYERETEEWHPSSRPHPYREWSFDLTILSGGPKRAVDGRKVIESGALARFSRELPKVATETSWCELNELIAQRWRSRRRTGTGVFRFALPELSSPGRLVIIEFGIEWGSTLPFANRTLTSIVAYERKLSFFCRILRALGIRRAA